MNNCSKQSNLGSSELTLQALAILYDVHHWFDGHLHSKIFL